MSLPDDSRERHAMDAIVERFEKAWRAGLAPRLDDFVGDGAVNRQILLVELVHVDLEYRLKAGQKTVVQDYLSRFPELQNDAEAVLGLITAEYRSLQLQGQSPKVEDYLQRFPGYGGQLAKRLDEA